MLVGNHLSDRLGAASVSEVLADQLAQAKYRVITTSTYLNKLIRLVDMILTAWRRRQEYDVAIVDTYNYRAFLWAEAVCWVLRRVKRPYILVLHAGLMPEFEREQPVRVRRLLNSASVVTTPSSYIAQSLAHIRADIVHLPNAVNLHMFDYQPRPITAPRLVWLRAFEQIYSPQTAIRSVEIVRLRFPQATLTLYGRDTGDGTFEACQALVEELKLQNAVQMPGKILKREVPRILSDYDVFLNTTRAESFGISVVEAAALGLCIVTTNVGELPYIWEHEKNALLVPPDDPQAMANAILRILDEPELAQSLSINARAKAEQYDWSRILPIWTELIERVIVEHNMEDLK